MHSKPYLKFHVDEVRFDGADWLIAFTPRGIGWEEKKTRPIPDSEMQQIWGAAGISVVLDEDSVRKHWGQIKNGVEDYLVHTYWTLDGKRN